LKALKLINLIPKTIEEFRCIMGREGFESKSLKKRPKNGDFLTTSTRYPGKSVACKNRQRGFGETRALPKNTAF